MPPKSRRTVEAAIRQTERTWQERHADRYRGRSELRFQRRDEQVVGACEEMCQRLREIRSELVAGRLDPRAARSEIRTMNGRHTQIAELHDTIVAEEPELARKSTVTGRAVASRVAKRRGMGLG